MGGTPLNPKLSGPSFLATLKDLHALLAGFSWALNHRYPSLELFLDRYLFELTYSETTATLMLIR
jgi:hypothetical protein